MEVNHLSWKIFLNSGTGGCQSLLEMMGMFGHSAAQLMVLISVLDGLGQAFLHSCSVEIFFRVRGDKKIIKTVMIVEE